ncbi:hypothetical protein BGZ65_001740 [Modicella reniformis]|uniref:RRM domain-containing protein n=1 Tax=Modicella reniformis TaxID=1440133 RepID=A0A9P6INN9_9FUNG|nr:hypothetical protein BGZ65_001740 [Modicella reniformis]
MAEVEMTLASEADTASAPAQTETVVASSPTLYIKNLNEKIKLEVLKKSLRSIFGQYGDILDIVAHSNIRMRGQAFVIFEDKDVATKAMAEVQGFPLYGRQMVIQHSKRKSDIHAKKDGEFEEHYKKRMLRKGLTSHLQPMDDTGAIGFANEFKPKKRQAMLLAKHQQKAQEQRLLEEQQQLLQQQQQQIAQQTSYLHHHGAVPGAVGGAGPVPAAGGVPMIPDEYLPRNSILFLQNLPHNTAESQLVSLFQQYPGFKELRTVPGKSGIAFVEYDNEYYSAAAKTALADYQIDPEHKMKVTFARK